MFIICLQKIRLAEQLEQEKINFEKEQVLKEKRKLEAEQIAKEDAERKKVSYKNILPTNLHVLGTGKILLFS